MHAVKDFNITRLAGMMPNQAHGYCSIEGEAGFGRSWCFRARHGQWELRISSTTASGDAEEDLAAAVRGEVFSSGADDQAGWWDGRDLTLRVVAAFAAPNAEGGLSEVNAAPQPTFTPIEEVTNLGEFAAGWKEHTGNSMPVDGDVAVQVRFRDGIGDGARGPAKRWNWTRARADVPHGGDIVSYRITESRDA